MSENINNNPIWQYILDLFPDNSEGQISPSDIREFVNAVQKYKEDQQHHHEKLIDVWTNQEIYRSDIIIIKNENQIDPDYQYNGIYVSKVDNPSSLNDLYLITKQLTKVDDIPDLEKPISNATQDALDLKYDKTGGNINGDIILKNKFEFILDESSNKVYLILKDNNGNQLNYLIFNPDGSLSGTLKEPINQVDLTNKKYVDDTIINNLSNKENFLGYPSQHGMILKSDITGNRYWDVFSSEWGSISGDINNQSDLINILSNKWDGSQDLELQENIRIEHTDNGYQFNILHFNKDFNYNNDLVPKIIIGEQDSLLYLASTINEDILLDNNTSIKSYDYNRLETKNLIRREINSGNGGMPFNYDSEIVVGDSDVRTVIFASDDLNRPFVRKGTYGNSIDYLIYTTEDFLISDFALNNHNHEISDINLLQDALNSKANIIHTHEISDVNNLDYELNNKANIIHIHEISDVNNLEQILNTKSETGHSHLIDNVIGLQNELDSKWNGIGQYKFYYNSSIIDELNNYVFRMSNSGDETGWFFDNKSFLAIGNPDLIINIDGVVERPIVIKNDSSIQFWNQSYTKKSNGISRWNDNDIVIGDSDCRSVIRVGDNTLDAVVRKGDYGMTTDYLIYTSEYFDYNDLATKNHTHQINEIVDLTLELDNRIKRYGIDTVYSSLTFENPLIFKNYGRIFQTNNMGDGDQVWMDNGIQGDTIFNIKRRNNPADYEITFYGNVRNTKSPVYNIDLTNKEYVDNNLNQKLNITGGTVTGNINIPNDNLYAKYIRAYEHIQAEGQLSTGVNINGNSAIQFNYNNGNNGIIWYDNSETNPDNAFKIDVTTAGEEYTLFHSGNLNLNEYVSKIGNSTIMGNVTVNSNDTINPAYFQSVNDDYSLRLYGDKINFSTSSMTFDIINKSSSTSIIYNNQEILTFYENAAPEITFDPTTDNSLVNLGYLSNNYVSKSGDNMSGSLTIDDGNNGDAGLQVSYLNISSNLKYNYFELKNDTEYFRIESDISNGNIDFKTNNSILMILEDGKAPKTPNQPTEDDSLTRKDYVDTKVSKSGDTMTGDLILADGGTSVSTKSQGRILSWNDIGLFDSGFQGLDIPSSIKYIANVLNSGQSVERFIYSSTTPNFINVFPESENCHLKIIRVSTTTMRFEYSKYDTGRKFSRNFYNWTGTLVDSGIIYQIDNLGNQTINGGLFLGESNRGYLTVQGTDSERPEIYFKNSAGLIRSSISYDNNSNNLYISKYDDSGIIIGNISIDDSLNISTSATPTSPDHLTNKNYVDTTLVGKVLHTSQSVGTGLSRTEINNTIQENQNGPSALDMSKSQQFYIIDADENIFFVRYFAEIDKFAFEKLTVR